MIRAIDSCVFAGLPVFAASSTLLKGILNLKDRTCFSNALIRSRSSVVVFFFLFSFSSQSKWSPFSFESPSIPASLKLRIQLAISAGLFISKVLATSR